MGLLREEIENLSGHELRKAVALYHNYRWGIVGSKLLGGSKAEPVEGFIEILNGKEYMGLGVPDWTLDIYPAISLVEEWRVASTPEGKGIHEISLTYENWDGIEVPAWYCSFMQYTDDPDDFQVFFARGDIMQVAICRAYLMWKEGISPLPVVVEES